MRTAPPAPVGLVARFDGGISAVSPPASLASTTAVRPSSSSTVQRSAAVTAYADTLARTLGAINLAWDMHQTDARGAGAARGLIRRAATSTGVAAAREAGPVGTDRQTAGGAGHAATDSIVAESPISFRVQMLFPPTGMADGNSGSGGLMSSSTAGFQDIYTGSEPNCAYQLPAAALTDLYAAAIEQLLEARGAAHSGSANLSVSKRAGKGASLSSSARTSSADGAAAGARSSDDGVHAILPSLRFRVIASNEFGDSVPSKVCVLAMLYVCVLGGCACVRSVPV